MNPLNSLSVTLLPLTEPQFQGSSPQPGLWLPALNSSSNPEPFPTLSHSLALLWATWGPGSRELWLGRLTDVPVVDVDECAVTDRCLGGHCVNTEGSFDCLCETGFQPSPESGECVGKGFRREWAGSAPMSALLPLLPSPQLPGTRNCSFLEAGTFHTCITGWMMHLLSLC